MTDLAKLIVKLEAQTAQYHAEMKKANDRLTAYQRQTNHRLGAMQKSWGSFASGLKRILVGVGVGVVLNKIITETSEAQKNLSQLEAVVKSTGGAAGFAVPKLKAMAEEFQRTTTFTDDAVVGMQAVLLQFTRLRGPEFVGAQQAIIDMSTRMGGDLNTAAIKVGKALNDPIRGMAGLSKAGIQFSKAQQTVIKDLVESGRLAEAQGLILKELEKKFGGAAVAARNTFGGAIAGLKNAFNDLFEVSTEGSSAATESINRLAASLSDPATKHAADTLLSGLITSLAWILENGAKVGAMIASIFGAGGTEAERLEDKIRFLEEQRDSFLPFVLTLGETFNPGGGAIGVLTPKEIDEQIAALVRQQEALLGVGVGGMEAAKALKEAGAAGGEMGGAMDDLGDDLAELDAEKRAKEIKAAGEAILGMVEDLREQIGVMGLGAVEAMRYRLEHGKIAAQFALAGPEFDKYKQEILDITAALEAKRVADEAAEKTQAALDDRVAEGQAVFDETRTATEKYAAEIIRLKDLLHEGHIDAETFNRAIAQSTEEWKKVTEEANKFFEEASRNTQDIIANFLEDIALSSEVSFDKIYQDFARMLVRLSAQAVAANIAGKLFGTGGVGSGGGWIGQAAGWLAGLFGGAGAGVAAPTGGGGGLSYGGPMAAGGNAYAGNRYRIGETGRAEWFFPGMDGQIIPEDALGGGGISVTNHFMISAPTGSVSRQTQTQIAAAAARGVSEAGRRNN